jgi:hypothetical protein
MPGSPARRQGVEYERLLDEFSDQLTQAVQRPENNEEEPVALADGGGSTKGYCESFLHPSLPIRATPGSEIIEFVMRVNSPLIAFKKIKPLLISHNLIDDVIVAWHHGSESCVAQRISQ